MTEAALTIMVLYALTMFLLTLPARFAKPFSLPDMPSRRFSIIVCARNEERRIGQCLQSIIAQDYPREMFEILVVNDASGDRTSAVASAVLKDAGIPYRIFSNPEQKGKKKSIEYAIAQSTHAYIVTRDADTVTRSQSWLRAIDAAVASTGAGMIICPVAISRNSGLLWAIQAIESQVLQFMTAGSAALGMPFLCSGANLAYSRELFVKTDGFSSHISIPSGDDVLLLEDAKRAGERIAFDGSWHAVAETLPCTTAAALVRQRVRWAAKFRVNRSLPNAISAVVVFAANAMFIIMLIGGFLYPSETRHAFTFVASKLCVDFLLLLLTPSPYRNPTLLWYSLPAGLLYPFYALFVAAGAMFYKPRWK